MAHGPAGLLWQHMALARIAWQTVIVLDRFSSLGSVPICTFVTEQRGLVVCRGLTTAGLHVQATLSAFLARMAQQARTGEDFRDMAGAYWAPKMAGLVCAAHFLAHRLRLPPPSLLVVEAAAGAPLGLLLQILMRPWIVMSCGLMHTKLGVAYTATVFTPRARDRMVARQLV